MYFINIKIKINKLVFWFSSFIKLKLDVLFINVYFLKYLNTSENVIEYSRQISFKYFSCQNNKMNKQVFKPWFLWPTWTKVIKYIRNMFRLSKCNLLSLENSPYKVIKD